MRQRVADDKAIQPRYLGAPRLSPAGEPAVRRERQDFPSSGPLQQSHGVVEGPSRVNHVVHDYAQRPDDRGGGGGEWKPMFETKMKPKLSVGFMKQAPKKL